MATVRKRLRSGTDGAMKITWVADYFDQNRQRHLKTFSSQKAANAWLLETLGEVARGVHTAERGSITLGQAAQLWLERGRAEGLERGTLVGYETLVRMHVVPALGNIKLAQLSAPRLEGWRDRLVAGLSRTRARRVLWVLKTILSEAQRRGLVAQNVALSVKIDIRKREQKKLEVGHDIPSREAVQQLLAMAGERYPRYRPLLVTAALTGLRASELRGLSWSAVDFAKRTITVRQRADAWGTLGLPKSEAGQRRVPMSPTVINTLREWRLTCPKSELDLVFPNTRGKVAGLANLTKHFWHPLQRRLGMVDPAGHPRFDFHALRHFAASLWIEQGVSPKRLQAMLGHSSIHMTFDVYGHLLGDGEDVHAKLAKAELGVVA
jgi:integrase